MNFVSIIAANLQTSVASSRRSIQWGAWALALLFLLTPFARLEAQTSLGQITGSVSDASASLVSGATITVRNAGTSEVRTAVSDSNGRFIFTNLPIGDYSIEVVAKGFRGEQRTGLAITADAKLSAEFVLQVGAANESVTVTSVAGETINTTSGELAHVIDTKQVEALPLNGRNYMQLMTLIPGAVVTNSDNFSVTTSLASTGQVINGNRSDSSNLTVDGAFNQAAGSNGSLINNVGADFIQEVKIETSNFSAEYGRTSGPVFNIVTKSGTNKFHGSAFEFVRNNLFDARPFFSAYKTHLVYNDFGGGVGGPILHDRLFFFFGEEVKRLRQQQTPTTLTVPSTAMLAGNFANITSGGKAIQLVYPGTTTPIPNNNIASLITADGKAIGNVYSILTKTGTFTDSPAGVTTLPSGNLIVTPSNPLNFHQELFRLDYKINDKNNIYGRWISDHNVLIDPFGTFSSGGLPTVPTQRSRPGQSYLVSETWNIRPSIINQATANFSFVSQHIPPYGVNWLRSTFGFAYTKLFANSGEYPQSIPSVAVSNFSGFSGAYFALNSPTTDIQIGDTMSIVKGNHLIKFGGVYIRDRIDQNGRPNYSGNASFTTTNNSSSTGLAIADALIGQFASYQEANADPVGHFRFSQPEVFAQDTWKAARKLSLEFGVRWQDILPLYAQGNNYGNYDPAYYNAAQAITVTTKGTVVPGSGNAYNGLVRTSAPIPADQVARVPNINTAAYPFIPQVAPRGLYTMHGAFGPRVGFAYAADDKTSIRGGFGGFYYRPEGNVGFGQVNIQPFLQNIEFDSANLSNISAGSPNNTALQSSVSAIDPNLKNPYVLQYSLGVQRELPMGILMETTYAGNVGHHLLRAPNINTPNIVSVAAGAAATPSINANFYNPYKGFGSITQNRSDSNTNYNSLQVYLSKRRGRLTSTVSYTFAKTLGDSSANNGDLANWQSLSYNYGELNIDRRHAFVATVVYQLPTLAGKNIALREVAGGWQVTGVVRIQSGPYYSITGNSATLGTRRASYAGGSMYAVGDRFALPNHQGQYLNPAAFAVAGPAAFGNAGVGSTILPGLEQGDVTASKSFDIVKGVQLKFQADAFNVLNKTNYSGVDTNISDSGFGRFTGANPPRQMQFGARVIF
jgi:hypothetical protein